MTLGILGGGQLGRMSAMAAARLGIKTIIFSPEERSPAFHVAHESILADYDDKEALKRFKEKVDVISYEFENIPVETVLYLEEIGAKVFPDERLLYVSQDRIKEKQFLNDLGIETARWKKMESTEDLLQAGFQDFIIKTTRFGYDGKGQISSSLDECNTCEKLKSFFETHKNNDLILEEKVAFTDEMSVIIARNKQGESAIYGPMLNIHKNHILYKTIYPNSFSKDVIEKAHEIAQKIADEIKLIGVLTVEFFICEDGRILANELAPRTHNSGHWTIDACAVSQFEQHVRAVCGLPLGSSEAHSDAEMLNLIGNDVKDINNYMKQDNACVHLYGKKEAREGRKMGHVTFLQEKS
tara:strand:- start:386 stop:1447 length:1062 start_codon:yes stop_codon:yes gene_type:complete